MKCPKCKFNSFEFLDTCKKCGADLGGFKKTHRISPVILNPGVGPLGAMTAAAVVEQSVPAGDTETKTEELFSWESAGEVDRKDAAFAGFDLGFEESPEKEVVQDTEFTGFSFSDQPDAAPEEPDRPLEETSDAFSFDEPAEEKPAGAGWDIRFDEDPSGMERYERMIDPEGMERKGTADGESADGEETENSYFGTVDFSFEPEESGEKAAPEGEKSPVAAPDKKPATSMEDFDKEFELIFSDDDTSSSGDKKNG